MQILGNQQKHAHWRYAASGKIAAVRLPETPSHADNAHWRCDILSFIDAADGVTPPREAPSAVFGNRDERTTIAYCRVSSAHQRDDLDRRVLLSREQSPDATIVTDIGSGISFHSRRLRKGLDRCFAGDVGRVMGAHKDRLARGGFELVEYVVGKLGVELVILDHSSFTTPYEEMANDLLDIVHVFACKRNGRRRHRRTATAEKKAKECPHTSTTRYKALHVLFDEDREQFEHLWRQCVSEDGARKFRHMRIVAMLESTAWKETVATTVSSEVLALASRHVSARFRRKEEGTGG